jgi:hypothetical protein
MRKELLLVVLCCLSQTVFAQTDSLSQDAVYDSRIASKASDPVFNGREHPGYHPAIQGIAYYVTDEWQKGKLVYQHIEYTDIYLKYDLVADELVVRHLNGITGVILFTPRIQSFSLRDKIFIYLRPLEGSGLKPGIYEEIRKGKLSLYAKRSTLINESIVGNVLERKFVDNTRFYVLKDGHYYIIKKQKDLMELLDGKKAEINARMKSSGIKYRYNRELALSKIVENYNQLADEK